MPSPLVDLSVAARFAGRALARRLRGDVEAELDRAAFETELERGLANLPPGVVRSHHWLTLPATEPPWRDTGIDLDRGAELSYFATGRVYASKPLDIWITAKNQLWTRLGEKGPISSSSRDSGTIARSEDDENDSGRLYVGNYFPNDWKDPSGTRLQGDDVYSTVSGEMRVLVIVWNVPAHEGLTALLRSGDPMAIVANEIDRRENAPAPPPGWHYLWHIGTSEVFRAETDEARQPQICCDVQGDVAILQKDVDIALCPDTEISWQWTVDELPGLLREDTIPSHDYLSLAVEFDNGWDITYYWSRALAEGTGFICPLPNWKHREFHVVVRSGESGLGTPVVERRPLLRDFDRYMKDLGDPPKRIRRVWLIANSVFMRQRGRCQFSRIRIHGEGSDVVVL
jgi:hypothetical protein